MAKQEVIDLEPSAPAGALATQTAAPLVGRAAASDPMTLLLTMIERGHAPHESVKAILDAKVQLDAIQARKDYNAAMIAFRRECPKILKARTPTSGPTYDYAAIEDIEDAVAPVLFQHGLSYSYPSSLETQPGKMATTVRISHVNGHFEDTTVEMPIPAEMRVNATQKAGAAISYGRRYSLCSALGLRLGGHDTDGRGLSPTTEAFEEATKSITIAQANELNSLGIELKIDKAQWLKRASENIGRPVSEWIDLPQSEYLKVRSAMMTKKHAAKV